MSLMSSRGLQVILCTYISLLISGLFVSLRFFVRWKLVKIRGREDVLIFFAWIAALVCAITMHLTVTKGGLGHRIETLTPAHITSFFKLTYASILAYNASLCLTKFAILLFCQRLFAISSFWRKTYYVVLAYISIYTIWVMVSGIVPCVPIQRYWDKSVDGGCLPNGVLWFLNAGLNISSDFIVVLLPIPSIYKLQLPLKQKIGVSLVFALGLFVCIISIVRLRAIYIGAVSIDLTYDTFDVGLWTCIEVNGAIVGACIPILKPLVRKVWPSLLSSGHSKPVTGYGFTTDRSKRYTIQLQDIATQSGNVGSAENILRNADVGSNSLGSEKEAGLRVQESIINEDATDYNETTMVEELGRHTSSDGWSGQSSQRPVYKNGQISTTEGVAIC